MIILIIYYLICQTDIPSIDIVNCFLPEHAHLKSYSLSVLGVVELKEVPLRVV